jgi:Ca2+:H+ antiporter
VATAFKSLKSVYFAVPAGALFLLALSWDQSLTVPIMIFLGLVLAASVYVAVSHAEVIALRVGEPYGSLILAVAVTIIEVGMIVVLVIDNPEATKNLARDTVFAAIMITTALILGASIVTKSLRLKFSTFNPEGAVPALAALASLSVLSLVLPSFTTSSPGPTFNHTQLVFAAVTSAVIYLIFVFMQTVRHRDFFLPPPRANGPQTANTHFKSPTKNQAIYSVLGLIASLVAVVGLAKVTSPVIQGVVSTFGLPQMVVALSIALIVLLPESISALKAAAYGRTQTSLNLALGSALASIGMTIPAIAVISIFFGFQVNLGLGPTEIALLFLTLFVSALTLIPGKASLLQGAVHLSIFAAFVLVVFTP